MGKGWQGYHIQHRYAFLPILSKGADNRSTCVEPCHELSSSSCPSFLAIVQTDLASTLVCSILVADITLLTNQHHPCQGPQKKSTPAIAPSTASNSSKILVNFMQKAVLTWQAKANHCAPLDDDDVAPQSQSTTLPAEDPTVTEPEVCSLPFLPIHLLTLANCLGFRG
jgi:hypothetical protein